MNLGSPNLNVLPIYTGYKCRIASDFKRRIERDAQENGCDLF
jgi:hypothetical protein